jgi:hypothetical protein
MQNCAFFSINKSVLTKKIRTLTQIEAIFVNQGPVDNKKILIIKLKI